MRSYRALWTSLAAAVVSVGVILAIATASVLTVVLVFAIMALMLGTLSANLQLLDHEGQAHGSISLMAVIRHGYLAGIAVVAFYGLATAIGIVVVPLTVLVAGTSPLVVSWWRRRSSPPRSNATTEHGQGAGAVRAARCSGRPSCDLDAMTPAELCLAWRRSYVELQHTRTAEAMAGVAEVRRELLDELERRNPSGFDQWLASGARAPSDPARYLLKPTEQRRR
ncbi:hypothetical protein [Kribbella sp. CA-247076]|uniref:hypothetical protein n=1 Tax=Kribbella sp. CA-247076 TaxID=3239941 RepID=UPI003D8C2327